MGFKGKSLKLFFVVFILVFLFGTLGSVLLRKYNEGNSPEKFFKENQIIENQVQAFPRIENMPSRNIVIDSTFTFAPKIVPMDEGIKLALLNSPDWLKLENSIVSGIPEELGTFKFVLRVEKGGEYVDQEFYLIVIEDENE